MSNTITCYQYTYSSRLKPGGGLIGIGGNSRPCWTVAVASTSLARGCCCGCFACGRGSGVLGRFGGLVYPLTEGHWCASGGKGCILLAIRARLWRGCSVARCRSLADYVCLPYSSGYMDGWIHGWMDTWDQRLLLVAYHQGIVPG